MILNGVWHSAHWILVKSYCTLSVTIGSRRNGNLNKKDRTHARIEVARIELPERSTNLFFFNCCNSILFRCCDFSILTHIDYQTVEMNCSSFRVRFVFDNNLIGLNATFSKKNSKIKSDIWSFIYIYSPLNTENLHESR